MLLLLVLLIRFLCLFLFGMLVWVASTADSVAFIVLSNSRRATNKEKV